MMNYRNSKELKLLTLAMHPQTPDVEALAAVRKLGAITNKRGGIKYLVYENDQEFLFPAEKRLMPTFALGRVNRNDDHDLHVGSVRP
jgi:hypothetical protein